MISQPDHRALASGLAYDVSIFTMLPRTEPLSIYPGMSSAIRLIANWRMGMFRT
jgi:hypothetical protein